MSKFIKVSLEPVATLVRVAFTTPFLFKVTVNGAVPPSFTQALA